jgi:pectinesterase
MVPRASATALHLAAYGLLSFSLPAFAADVHVRVDLSAPHANPGNENLTVFPTIQNALDHHPFATPDAHGKPGRVFIEITPGIYHERIIVTQNHTNITLVGLGKSAADTIITNALNAKQAGGTFFTETAEINGDGFEADNLTFENTAGNTGQAVALAVRADRVIIKRCTILGHQDTLFADFGRQYYLNDRIVGGVDFIFGNAAAVFEASEIVSNGHGYITAQSRTSPAQNTGFVIYRSTVTADRDTQDSPEGAPGSKSIAAAHGWIGLGRPWRPYARVVYLDTVLNSDAVNPAGWNNWSNPANEKTAYFAESGSKGPGASPSTRAPWSHRLTPAQATRFLPQKFLAGTDHWNPVPLASKLP